MGKSYRPYLPDQEFLLPPSLRDWLPENHLVYFVSDVIDNLNLSAMDVVYGDEQRGQPPYDPRLMTKVLVYGYCVGGFSSRRIQQRPTPKKTRCTEQINEGMSYPKSCNGGRPGCRRFAKPSGRWRSGRDRRRRRTESRPGK